jgi:hypothetical protein
VNLDEPLINVLPHPDEVNRSLGTALRQVHLLRRLLKLSETAEEYRSCLRNAEDDPEDLGGGQLEVASGQK